MGGIDAWHFYKYDISAYDALGCDFPLLEPPPRHLHNESVVITADVWLAHTVVMYTNRAFVWYKERACPNFNPNARPRWLPKPDSKGGEYVGAPGNTWIPRGPERIKCTAST